MGRSADNPVKEALADLGSVTVLFLESLRSLAAKPGLKTFAGILTLALYNDLEAELGEGLFAIKLY